MNGEIYNFFHVLVENCDTMRLPVGDAYVGTKNKIDHHDMPGANHTLLRATLTTGYLNISTLVVRGQDSRQHDS